MNKNILIQILKYLDCFGTKFNFYIERNRKLYTPLGGILTLFSFIVGIIIFILINLDDLLRNIPNSTTSTAKENYKNIKFRDEKIWIPWRIADFQSKTINHSEILYPIIYYYKGIKNKADKLMNLSYNIINYKLCNETSMMNSSLKYIIDVELDQLYCIDMEELDMGGSWDADFINYITFDIYNCKNGINYDENNPNCTSYDKIIEEANKYDYLEFELYFPVVHYQPINKTIPIIVKYDSFFYHLSLYSIKIDRIYLQQYILNDDKGWISKKEYYSSFWGCQSIVGDSYGKGNKKDIMNEGSTSRLYSFNIYLLPDVIYYHRNYKKIFLIIAEGLTIINIVCNIFKLVAKIIKISSGNKKLTELLFENLKEKKYFLRLKTNNIIITKKHNSDKNINKHLNINEIKDVNDFSIIKLIHEESNKKLIIDNNKNPRENHKGIKINKKEKNKVNKINNNYLHKDSFNQKKTGLKNNNINQIEENEDRSGFPFNNLNKNKDNNNQNNKNTKNNELKIKSKYIKKSLFPYKYYLCSIFIHNIDNYKTSSFFFTKKFIAVYNFICQLFDISSYLILQREFQIMKNTLMEDEYKDILEKGKKINVNDRFFNNNMEECLVSKKFSIFGKVKQSKGKNH